MKKTLLTLTLALLGALGLYADNEPMAYGQLTGVSPSPGATIDPAGEEGGFGGMTFNFKVQPAEVNRNANKFARLYHDDELIAAVPASNNRMILYDDFAFDVWTVSFFLNQKDLAVAPGTYKVTFDEGLFLLGKDKTPSEKVVIYYYINQPLYSITPAPGNGFKELEEWTLTFPKAVSVERDESKTFEVFYVFGAPDAQGNQVTYRVETEINGNEVVCYVARPITGSGTWKFDASAGAFKLTDASGNITDSPEIIENYVIPNYGDGIPEITPAPGDIQCFPAKMVLTLPGDAEAKIVNQMAICYICPVNEDGTYSKANYIARYQAWKDFKYGEDGEIMKGPDGQNIVENPHLIVLRRVGGNEDIYPAPGKYVLLTGSRMYNTTLSDKFISELEYEYNVLPREMQCTIYPDKPVTELPEVKFTFGENDTVEVVTAERTWVHSPISWYIFFPRLEAEGSKTVVFTTSVPITEQGVYTIDFPQNAVKVNGEFISVKAQFTVDPNGSGVAGIEEGMPEYFDIYSIDGRLVKTNATAADVAELAKGLYIAAGRKLLVK